jgi:hypothetical protein
MGSESCIRFWSELAMANGVGDWARDDTGNKRMKEKMRKMPVMVRGFLGWVEALRDPPSSAMVSQPFTERRG